VKLHRHRENPVLLPDAAHPWEARNVFNCGVLNHEGKVVLLYRAQGWESDVSHLGYAESTDGVHFQRGAHPVFSPGAPTEIKGVEDPRLTVLDGQIHMLYTAWSPEAIQVGHASTRDFLGWERHGIVFPGPDNKDAALFPRKINGRYVAFHRIPPSMWLAWSDDLVTWGDYQQIMEPRPEQFDSLKLGAGGPPIETDAGWLVIYHGVDHDRVYRLGVALLDTENPAKVLNRPREAILEPEEPWEIQGEVPNVVFTCGTATMDGRYLVYYGGADRVISLATADQHELLEFAATGS
jgi:predicted GH43/DUF377 family glycosyl hydrolase